MGIPHPALLEGRKIMMGQVYEERKSHHPFWAGDRFQVYKLLR
jgi:hypothetical protein